MAIRKTKTREQIIAKALKILESNKHRDIYFFCDLANELGYARQYLYAIGLDKDDSIKEALEKNKINFKKALRNKWYMNDNATTQLALYKLLANEEETKRLANNVDMSLSGNLSKAPFEIKIVD